MSERSEWTVHEPERIRAAEKLRAKMDTNVTTPTLYADEYRKLGYLFADVVAKP